jgi:hypothetical protein
MLRAVAIALVPGQLTRPRQELKRESNSLRLRVLMESNALPQTRSLHCSRLTRMSQLEEVEETLLCPRESA